MRAGRRPTRRVCRFWLAHVPSASPYTRSHRWLAYPQNLTPALSLKGEGAERSAAGGDFLAEAGSDRQTLARLARSKTARSVTQVSNLVSGAQQIGVLGVKRGIDGVLRQGRPVRRGVREED